MSLSLTASFINYMTLFMIASCLVSCILVPGCRIKQKSLIGSAAGYVFIMFSMLVGMYLGKAISIELHFEMFYRYFFVVSCMSVFTLIGYYLLVKTLFKKVNGVC